MFLVSGPDLVIEQCKAGVLGAFPALNARPQTLLDSWLTQIEDALERHRRETNAAQAVPYGVNLIVNPANKRLEEDLEVCVRHKAPVIITSLSAPTAIAKRVHDYGGIVFHDVVKVRHAEKALEAGVDGIILVCAGAGGHAGRLNPFALVNEIRQMFGGPLVLAGAITNGAGVLAAERPPHDQQILVRQGMDGDSLPAGLTGDGELEERVPRHEPVAADSGQ